MVIPVHDRVEQVRMRKGVSKAHIARKCGHSISWYSDLSKGRRGMSVKALQDIAVALEVNAKIFFDDDISDTLIKNYRKEE